MSDNSISDDDNDTENRPPVSIGQAFLEYSDGTLIHPQPVEMVFVPPSPSTLKKYEEIFEKCRTDRPRLRKDSP